MKRGTVSGAGGAGGAGGFVFGNGSTGSSNMMPADGGEGALVSNGGTGSCDWF